MACCKDGIYHCVISGFGREVADNCALLGHYAASIGKTNDHCSPRNIPGERSSRRIIVTSHIYK